jgi:hypothetical protein
MLFYPIGFLKFLLDKNNVGLLLEVPAFYFISKQKYKCTRFYEKFLDMYCGFCSQVLHYCFLYDWLKVIEMPKHIFNLSIKKVDLRLDNRVASDEFSEGR